MFKFLIFFLCIIAHIQLTKSVLEVRQENTDVKLYAQRLFENYKRTVSGKNYDDLFMFYDEYAVLIERGKKYFFGSDIIVKAIKDYHKKMGPSSTHNYDVKIEYTDRLISIISKYKFKSNVSKETLEGEYIQYWRSEVGQAPKIIRDEFSIEKSLKKSL